MKFRLEAETFNPDKRYSRIWFDSSLPNVTNVDERILDINRGDRKYCQKHLAYLKKTVHDIQTPIQIKMSYSLVDEQPISSSQPGDPVPSLENDPVLNQQQADRVFLAKFHNDCGGDVCHSQLSVRAHLSLPFSDQFKKHQLILGQSDDLFLNVSVMNEGESAYEAQLFIIYPSYVSFGAGKTSLGEACALEKNAVVCNLGNPLKNDGYIEVSVRFDLTKLDETISDFELIVIANSTSKEENPKPPLKFPIKVDKRITLSVKGTSFPDSEFEQEGGEVKGESAIKYLEEIGPPVEHTYTIYNDGTWKVSNLEVHIEWPYQLPSNRQEGKWLLYMHEEPIIEPAGKCSYISDYVNPLHIRSKWTEAPLDYLREYSASFPASSKKKVQKNRNSTMSNALYNRIRRSTNNLILPEIYRNNGREEKVVNMNCLLNTAKCITLVCTINEIPKGQSSKIVVKSRLWNATLVEDYADVDLVKIVSRAKIYHVPVVPNEFQVETVVRILHKKASEHIPLLIIIAAVVIGLLLFTLLTLLLWKLGFFKRRRPDPILSGKLERRLIDEYHD